MKYFFIAALFAATLMAQAPQPAPAGDVVTYVTGVGNFAHIVADLQCPSSPSAASRLMLVPD